MPLEQDAKEILKQTSRTFYPSIVGLPSQIREAVTSAYLSLRAIDEIEDHPRLTKATKVHLLKTVNYELRCHDGLQLMRHFRFLREELAEVTFRLEEWLALAPKEIAPAVRLATAVMSERMAYWVGNNWSIRSKDDLDQYTFCVAGAVGVLLSDLWLWYDKTPSCKQNAVHYGRGLQAVNILRNRKEDLNRGVDFFPLGWNQKDFFQYAKSNLSRGDAYVNGFPLAGAAHTFCSGPQALAYATLEALERGEAKLSRSTVLEILGYTNGATPLTDSEEVVLVNQYDEVIGREEKIAAHAKGILHRAFSVFIVNSSNQLLVQRRTLTKYHSRGLWSNTCCGHPRPSETIEQASQRRLKEEMGFDSELTKLFHFIYRVELEDGLIEHEYDHVLIGHFDGVLNPNYDEVSEWRWMELDTLKVELGKYPESYTYWFRIAFNDFYNAMNSTSQHSSHVHS